MNRTRIYLEEAQTQALDRAAKTQGITRAELVRRLITRGLEGSSGSDLASDLDAIDQSFGILGGAELMVRAPEKREEYLGRLAGS